MFYFQPYIVSLNHSGFEPCVNRTTGFCILTRILAMAATQKNAQMNQGDQKEKKRKESIFDLSKYIDKNIRVKFAGGREASGNLKGYDPLFNLVMDNTIEFLRDPDDPYRLTENTRALGLVVCRGTAVVLICPVDGMERIANPFVPQE